MAKVRKDMETQTPTGDFFEEEIAIPTEAPSSTSLYDLSGHYAYLQVEQLCFEYLKLLIYLFKNIFQTRYL